MIKMGSLGDPSYIRGPIVASIASFVRNTPVGTLKSYFEKNGIGLPPAVDWGAPEPAAARNLLSAFAEIAPADRTRVENDIDRVAAIANEPGQVALYSLTQDRRLLDERRNPNDRSLWMFLNEPDAFRRAEEVRFTDERRHGRMWDGFVCAPDLHGSSQWSGIGCFQAGHP